MAASHSRRLLAALIPLLAATAAPASSPNLVNVRPVGAQRGTEVEVNLTGARLADAKEILFYRPGIETTAIEAVGDAQVKVKFKIAPDCRLGLHYFRIRAASGLSELRTFSVGAMPEATEVEPNNDFAAPQPIAMNSVVNGVAENEDIDYFVVDAKKGDRISAEIEGIRLGISLFDPYVAILDAKRFELASSDDTALLWVDAFASTIAPEDGKYIIAARESAYAGNGNCLYRLHVGDFPRASATIPSGGKVGEAVALRWIGDARGELSATLTLPATPEWDFGVFATDAKGTSPHPNFFRLSPFGNVVEVEPNENHDQATPFAAPLALNGVIGAPGDADHYVFAAKKNQVFDVKVQARSLRSPLDSVLYVAKKGSGAFVGNDDNVSPDSFARITIPEDGDYVISITDHLKKGGPEYFYRIEVGPVEPKLALSLPNEKSSQGQGAIAVAVPRGNRQAILVNASRVDFGGDLLLAAEGLPAGMAMEADAVAASQAVIPVLFTATADAPVAGALARMSGKPADPMVVVPSEFSQIVELVNGQNNIPFWIRTVDRMAVAVTDECPFAIEIVEPKVPLVRSGSMALKVVAKRKEGFTAPIAISLPWNPPGVSSAGGVAIPERQNEAVIPLNADGGAELKTWKIVVNGTAGVGNGPITVSTQLAKLAVAAPFVSFAYQPASVEQGKETDLAVKVAKAVDFPGEATVNLLGLPNKVLTDPKAITKDTTDLVFHLKTDATSPAGNHGTLMCQVIVTQDGEPIVHNLGGGQLRIDVPLPPKPNAPAPAPMPEAAPAPMPVAAAPPKPLSRLEKLRLEQQEKAKAAAAAPKN